MIKRLPSRNQRSKSITMKHVLQICLLVGVCFWLAYQVKRSHDKKREFEEKDADAFVKTQIGDQILKLGRKDLNPHVGGITKNHKNDDEEEGDLVVEDEENKREEEPEEENKHEEGQEEENKLEDIQDKEREDQGEEENKHEVEDQDDEDNKSDETEDEGKGVGDEEIDESDREKTEAEMDRDEEFVDGEKEKEESDERENENEGDDKESLGENQNIHEAREENYKADDASSAVTHDNQANEKEAGKVEHSIEDGNVSILEKNNRQNNLEDGTQDDSASNINSQMAVTDSSLKETTGMENSSFPNSSKPTNISTSMATDAINHSEADSSVTDTTEIGNNASKGNAWLNETTGAGHNTITSETYIDSSGSSLQNAIEKVSESDSVQNSTASGTDTGASEVMQFQKLSQVKNTTSGETQSSTNPVATGSTENNVTARENSIGLGTEIESGTRSEAAEEAEKNSRTPYTRGNAGANEAESEGSIHSRNTEEDLSSSGTETLDAAQHDPIDSSDSNFHQEVAQARTDVDTLPNVKTGVDTSDEIATE